MKKKELPSKTQAHFLAHFWGEGKVYHLGGCDTPTAIVCVEQGWIIPNGDVGKFPNGQEWIGHAVSNLGLLALEKYLMRGRNQNADLAREFTD